MPETPRAAADPFTWDGARDRTRFSTEVGATWVNDVADNPCFGCRQHGAPGLRMSFTRTATDTVESRVTVDRAFAGWATVIHGGIQATLLDEVLGCTAWTACGGDPSVAVVTVELTSRFRKPCPIETPLVVRGVVDRVEDRNVFVTGEIVGEDGIVYTTGSAVCRRVR